MASGFYPHYSSCINSSNLRDNELAGKSFGAFTKSSSSSAFIYYTLLQSLFLKLVFTPALAFVVPVTNNILFKKFIKVYLVVQDQLFT